jgi:biopolymer transport protein ExbD
VTIQETVMSLMHRKKRKAPVPEPAVMVDMNTTPLIDVMLVLLIMMIITIPIQLHAVNLNMPVGTPPPAAMKPEVVNIDVDDTSAVYWQGEVVAHDRMEVLMQAAAAQGVQPEIHLRPRPRAKYEVVAGVMASAQRIGLSKIGLVGSEQYIE